MASTDTDAVPGGDDSILDQDGDRLVREERTAAERRAMALGDMAARASSGVPLSTLLDELCNLSVVALGADYALLFSHDARTDRLLLRTGWGTAPSLLGRDVSTRETNQAGYTFRTGAPVLSADTANDPRFGFPDDVGTFRPKAALSVPISIRRRTWGVLVVACISDHRFGAADLRFLQAIGQLGAVGIDRAEIENSRVESETRLNLALDTEQLGIWEYRMGSGELWISATAEKMLGMEPDSFDGNPLTILAMVPTEELDGFIAAARSGTVSAVGWRHTFHLDIGSDTLRLFEVSARSVVADDGTFDQIVGVAADVTERREAEAVRAELVRRADAARATAVRAQERLAWLAESGARFAEQLDAHELAEVIVDATVGSLADLCVVDRYEPSGEVEPLAIAHAVPELLEPLRDAHLYRLDGRSSQGELREMFVRGEHLFIPEVPEDMLRRSGLDDEHGRLLVTAGARSVILLPLLARGQLIGGVTLGRLGSSPPFDEEDLALAQGMAARAAISLDNARLFADRAVIVRALQETLIPPAIPEVEGLEICAAYRVAEDGVDIGGDFYDVVDLGPSGVVVLIGDVSGKGPSAAGVTGVVRQSVRALAARAEGPGEVLATVNEVLVPQIAESRFCTALLAQLTWGPDGTRVRIANAGHLRPYLVPREGAVEMVEVKGTLLGVMPTIRLREVTLDVAPGDALVLVTDGITEARGSSGEFGEQGLRDALESCDRALPAALLADQVVAATAAFCQGRFRDDLAVVVIRVVEGSVT